MPDTYDPATKLLHRLALGSDFVAAAAFDLERALHGRGLTGSSEGNHVFVSGLARAGTTVLLRVLHRTGAFCSLTYRDMPFVLAPNSWARLTALSRRDPAAGERAHGDGITVDADSPEALDEVFWRVFSGPSYIGRGNLEPMEADDAILEDFRLYVALILKRYQTDRYLSKNNNNLLRLPSLRRAFPRAVLLVPFRDPLQQARSLQTQHRRFVKRQREHPFTRDYMTWLAHHEFGLDHRPFAGIGADADPDAPDLDHWLRQWVAVYGHVWRQAQAGLVDPVFFSYELMCAEPARVGDTLEKLLRLSRGSVVFEPRKSRADLPAGDEDGRLLQQARCLYKAMWEASCATC